MERITCTVSPTGETVIKVEGCAGPDCKTLTKAIEQAVGRTVKDIATPEMHQQPQGQQTHIGGTSS